MLFRVSYCKSKFGWPATVTRPFFFRMYELLVRTFLAVYHPAFTIQPFQHVPNLHSLVLLYA